MSLFVATPQHILSDRSAHKTIKFVSYADGTLQKVDVYSPQNCVDQLLPLVIAPHPITWTAKEDYHGGLTGGYKRGYHAGWYGLADRYRVIIAMPHGHACRVEGCSLASSEQINDMFQLVSELSKAGYSIDPRRIYACGESMGGQEVLVAAGCKPDLFAAVIAFNPIVDLAAWHHDLQNSESSEIRKFGTDQRIVEEVGGLPSQVPHLYAQRSAMQYAEGLGNVPTLIFWSDHDLIIPRQATCHTFKLYQTIKALNTASPIAEYNHTHIHGKIEFNETTCWQLHEWCDYELALRWLLVHRR